MSSFEKDIWKSNKSFGTILLQEKHKPVKVYKKLKQCLYEQEYCYFKWVSRKSYALEILNIIFLAG